MRGSRKNASVIVVLAAGMLLVASACTDGSTGGTEAGASPQPTAGSPSMPSSSPLPPGPVAVEVSLTEIGGILTDGEGRTLYVYLPDTAKHPACVDACLATWLPVYVQGRPEVDADVDEGVVETVPREGNRQLVVGGQPAYLFAGDEEPGDMNGQAVDNLWYMVAPDGSRIVGVN